MFCWGHHDTLAMYPLVAGLPLALPLTGFEAKRMGSGCVKKRAGPGNTVAEMIFNVGLHSVEMVAR
jgi:hypothetical protein